MSFSQNIKKLRLEKNLTQEQLASMLGISAQAVSKWETSETYPDGAMLVPLANALDTSLDTLFDNKANSMKDISTRIRNILHATPAAQRFHISRDICWQIEKGLFDCKAKIDDIYSPDEINTTKHSSYVLNDYGFTHVSNGPSPFFSLFPEYDENLSVVIGNGEEMRKTFECLSSSETMCAILFIYKKEANFTFEADFLADICKIDQSKIATVLDNLLELHLLSKKDIEIDGKMRTLYSTNPTHKLISLLLFARELNYTGAYCYQSHWRNKPFLK